MITIGIYAIIGRVAALLYDKAYRDKRLKVKVKEKERKFIMGVKVLLDSVDKVRDFIDITRSAPYDIDLISGRSTYLDAKSLLGVLSCDCRKPLLLDIHAGVEERAELLLKLEKFVVA